MCASARKLLARPCVKQHLADGRIRSYDVSAVRDCDDNGQTRDDFRVAANVDRGSDRKESS